MGFLGCKCCGPYDVVCYSASNASVILTQYHGHGGYNLNGGRDIDGQYNAARISVSDYSVIVASESSLSIAAVGDSGEAISLQKSIGDHEYWLWSNGQGYQGGAVPPGGQWPQNIGDPWFLQSGEDFRYGFRCSRSPMSDDAWWIAFRHVTREPNSRANVSHDKWFVGYVSLSNPTIKSVWYRGFGGPQSHADTEKVYAIGNNWRDDNTPRTQEEMEEHNPYLYADFGDLQTTTTGQVTHYSTRQFASSGYFNNIPRSIDGMDKDPGFEGNTVPVRCSIYPVYVDSNQLFDHSLPSGFMNREGICTDSRRHLLNGGPFFGNYLDERRGMLCMPIVYSSPGSDYFWAGTGTYNSNGIRNYGPLYCGGGTIGVYRLSKSSSGLNDMKDMGQETARFRTADAPSSVNSDGSRVYPQVAGTINGPFCYQNGQGENQNRDYLYAANANPLPSITQQWTWWNGSPPSGVTDTTRTRYSGVGSCKLSIIDMTDTIDENGDPAFSIAADTYFMPLPRWLKEFPSPFGTTTYNGNTVAFLPQDMFVEAGHLYVLLADESNWFQWRRICKYKINEDGLELIWTITPEHDWQVFHSFAVKNGRVWAAVSASDEYVFQLPSNLYPVLLESDIPTGERFESFGNTFP